MDQIINSFYSSFQQQDAEGMVACYHKDIQFEDPAFGKLHGEDAKAMWKMLCKNAKDLKVECSQVKAEGNKGSAHWEAWYTFSQTGRPVHNIIEASFEFQDGLIIKHTDVFNLHRWAGQAMGWKGKLLGGTGFFQKKLQHQTNKMLTRFKEKNADDS